MHFGNLPLHYEPGRSHLNASTFAANTLVETGISRRSVLGLVPIVLGFVGGAATSVGCFEVFGWRQQSAGDAALDPKAAKAPLASVEPGTVDWALWIQHAPERVILDSAGELERVRMRTRGDPRLTPVFVRLLEVALASEASTADQAGAIALRCLDRLGADHHLRIFGARIETRGDRPATMRELKLVRRPRGGRNR